MAHIGRTEGRTMQIEPMSRPVCRELRLSVSLSVCATVEDYSTRTGRATFVFIGHGCYLVTSTEPVDLRDVTVRASGADSAGRTATLSGNSAYVQ
jgi:hypothetical protein